MAGSGADADGAAGCVMAMSSDKLHVCPISERASKEQAPQLATHTFKRASAASTMQIAASNCRSEWLQNVLPGKCTTAADTAFDKWSRSFSLMPKTEPYTLFFAMAFLGAITVRWSVLPSEM